MPPPQELVFSSVTTTLKFDCGLVVTIECEANDIDGDPVYRVFIDQFKVPGRPKDKDHYYDLLALGLQATVETPKPDDCMRKSGTLKILSIYGDNVKLGWPDSQGQLGWKKATTSGPKSKIRPYREGSPKHPPGFIKADSERFGLRVLHLDCVRKGKPKWKHAVAAAGLVEGGGGGTNVPPPVPPGSSVGEEDN